MKAENKQAGVTQLATDAIAERLLTESQCKYRLEEVPVSQIKANHSISNYTRPDGTNQATVEEYTEAYKNRDPFPAIVVLDMGTNYAVIGGHHRLEAATRANIGKLWAYVVAKSAPQTVQRLAFELNAYHGRNVSLEQKLTHAAELVEKDGMDVKEASMRSNVCSQRLRDFLKERQVDKVLSAHSVDGSKLQLAVKRKLHNIQDIAAKVETAKAILRANMETRESCLLIDEVKSAGGAYHKVLGKVEVDAIAPPKKDKKNKRTEATRFINTVGALRRIIAGKRSLRSLGIVSPSESLFNEINEVSNALQRLSSR